MPNPTNTGGGLMGYPSSVDTGLITPWIIPSEENVMQGSSFTLTANTVYLYLLELQGPATIPSMRYRMGATATGTVDLGIYDGSGNLLGHTGAVSTVASGLNTINLISSLNLSPGRYALALCPSNSTDTYIGLTGAKAGGGRWATATNAGTAGVLPGTTGTILTATVSPITIADVTGGAP